MSHRVLSPQQFFHGTNAELGEGEHIEPGHGGGEMSQFFGGSRGASRVFVATTPEGAARYGQHVYEVRPARGSRGRPDIHGTYAFSSEGHPHIEAHSFKAPMRIVRKVEGASYSPVIPDQERLENLRWLKEQGHEVSPEGEQFLREHG